ncbi:glutamate--tRNA ligase [Hydrogenibacillus schlegelii]|uniref:Glutamate--tRNA ligase n=2 Tax=Hydrogenibacillus schlegelii TaxID=1484 RepID=A0A179IPD7_HYDSH|nr:glutamate--tRNA ligase [Hydrogenibacillus schlegelii]OAR04546.1 hypothetical protein SA87_07675 [Hydrogenibacillus schlegelii]
MREPAEPVRVRYAPSPTGPLHIGGARTALFNFLFARHYGGAFVVRIEDTDRRRNVPGAEAEQLAGLRWLGLAWDEGPDVGGPYGPYRSSERLALYRSAAEALVDAGAAYPCFCPEGEACAGGCGTLPPAEARARMAETPHAIRLRVPEAAEFVFHDLVRGPLRFRGDAVGDVVLLKRDGTPTYQFAVVVDDHHMRITHVLRGEEHLPNTPKQLAIYAAFGWAPPAFLHLPLILNAERKKMSKRDAAAETIARYRDLGALPEAVVNVLALLGWSPKGTEEVFTPDELVRRFSPSGIGKSPAVFDPGRLRWLNQAHLKRLSDGELARRLRPYAEAAGWLAPDEGEGSDGWARFVAAVRLVREELAFLGDVVPAAAFLYRPDEAVLDAAALSPAARAALFGPEGRRAVAAALQALQARDPAAPWTPEAAAALLAAVKAATGLGGRALFLPLRLAATGREHGPALPDVLAWLGPVRFRRRLERALALAAQMAYNGAERAGEGKPSRG